MDLQTQKVAPKVTSQNLGPTIVVRVDQNKLYLYDGFQVERTWSVATAKPGYTTPVGDWDDRPARRSTPPGTTPPSTAGARTCPR